MGLPGLDECNYALKSAAGVNSLPSQLALVARTLPVFVYSPRLDARRQGLQTCMQTGSSQQTSHRYGLKELGSQSLPSSRGVLYANHKDAG